MLPRMPSLLTKPHLPGGGSGGGGGGSSHHPGVAQSSSDEPYVTADEKEYMRNQRRDYFYRNGKKFGADGKPYVKVDPNEGKYPLGTGDDDEDPDAPNWEQDDQGRDPDEPGYGKGPDWRPPFQTGGVDDPSDAEIAFMMDDANYGIGGDLNETNTDTGANIETFELGLGYGNEGGWTPTKRSKPSTLNMQPGGGIGVREHQGALRRVIPEKQNAKSLISNRRQR